VIGTKPTVCHVTTACGASGAGVFEAIRGLVTQLGRRGRVDLRLLHPATADAATDERAWSIPHVETTRWTASGPRFFSYSGDLEARLPVAPGAVMHQHGIWQYHSLACSARRRRHGVRRLVSPHGMLHPWALQVRSGRKRAAWIAYERGVLADVDAFHATAAAEAAFIRACGLKQPIAVIPHGVDLPATVPDRGCRTRRTALFLSRLHPGKRVADLLTAWARLRPRHWELVIAGPDETGQRAELESFTASHGMSGDVRFVGPVHGAARDRLFEEADLFVLPSLSENYGLVVAEALASGLPVITTTGTPWKQLPGLGCGWWIPPGSEPLTELLRGVVDMDAAALAEMGTRGRDYALAELAWDRVAMHYESLYRWLAAGEPRPSFVEI